MTRHDDLTRIHHMLDHAREAVEMLGDTQLKDLEQNRMLQLALVRLVKIVGEAATRVSDAGQGQYPTIPWQKARGMRNRLVHGYDKIDLQVLWDTITDDLPSLLAELERILT